MGDYKNFIDFVMWGVQKFPAKKYFVVIWNHGSGWHSLMNLLSRSKHNHSPTSDISHDDYTGNKITTVEMGYAFRYLKDQKLLYCHVDKKRFLAVKPLIS